MELARTRHAVLIAVALLLAAALAAQRAATAADAAAATMPPPLLQGTPLVLKDGRMAYVTVRPIPFEPGADALAPAVAAEVAELAAGLATDCFLTAQAIGHVEPGAAGEGDTLASHRLARARAERVQKALADKGLPANAVASVWDWQFLVREPRVTLWVFSVREGEDCKGKPLRGKGPPEPAVAAAEPAADVPPAKPGAKPGAKAAAAPKPAERPEGEARLAAAPTGPPAGKTGATAVAAANPAPASEGPSPTAAEGRAVALATESGAEPAVSPGDVSPAAGGGAGADGEGDPTPPPPRQVAALPPDDPAPGEGPAGDGGRLELVFDSNSSYLPSGAAAELRRWLEGLPRARGYAISLAAAVGAADVKGRDQEQAARYGRWLAERRLGRVAEWLERNAQVPGLDLSRALLEGDGSRRVVLEARPLP